MENTEVHITRSDLYEKVWEKPIVTLSKEWRISDVGLAKICRRHDIPRPGLGYWAKLQFGKPVKKTPLPKQENNPTITIRPYGEKEQLIDEEQASEAVRAWQEIAPSVAKLVVPDELMDPHPLIVKTDKSLRSAKPDHKGLISPKARGCLSVTVTKETLDRALRIFNTLLRALEAQHYGVVVVTQPVGDRNDVTVSRTLIQVLGEQIEISISERSRGELHVLTKEDCRKQNRYYSELFPHKDWIFTPTGLLSLHIAGVSGRGLKNSFQDTDRRKIETVLPLFIRAMITAAVEKRKARLEAEAQSKRWAEERRQHEIQEERRREYQKRLKHLEEDLKEFDAYVRMQNYIKYVRMRADAVGESTDPATELGLWLTWMERVASQHDPLANGFPQYSAYGEGYYAW